MSGAKAEALWQRALAGQAPAEHHSAEHRSAEHRSTEHRSIDYLRRYIQAADRVDRHVPEADHVFQQEGRNLQLYHCNGLSALRCIVLAMIAHDVDPPRAAMDFGCAYGRVLRYLAAAFPECQLTASDVRADAVEYCARAFGALPVLSSVDLPSIAFPRRHDVIWLGSVITHFSADDSKLLLRKMLDNLNPGGLVVFSLHGRVYPMEVQAKRWKILGDADFALVEADYRRSGFGYRDYPGRPGIGASLTAPGWVFDLVRNDPELTFSYQERAWMGWHDVAVIKKGPVRTPFSHHKDQPY